MRAPSAGSLTFWTFRVWIGRIGGVTWAASRAAPRPAAVSTWRRSRPGRERAAAIG
ncbi:MAG TPA: hypothetical protein VNZ85_03415 [Caulobacter sp.]|nr:hypothetical protein [Caulobacter sp.]